MKKHPDYEQAKQGNVQDAAPAAKRLASAMLTHAALAAIRRLSIEGALIVISLGKVALSPIFAVTSFITVAMSSEQLA